MNTDEKDRICVRFMTLSDTPQIAQIEREVFSDPWSERSLGYLCGGGSAVGAVIDDGVTVAAYGGMEYAADEAHITNIAVRPEYRRRGYAAAVMRFLEEFAKSRGAERAILDVRPSNTPAVSLYTKLGYVPAGIVPHGYSHPSENALVMVKKLTEGPSGWKDGQ